MPRGDFGGGTARGVLDVATEALESALDGRDGRPVLCHGVGTLFEAAAAAHVRYDPLFARSSLCMWRRERPGVASVVTLDQPERLGPAEPRAAHDWWIRSAARIATLDWFSRPHLAELPLSVETTRPSMVVVARDDPFTEAETQDLTFARRHLLTVDRVIARLMAAPEPAPPAAARPPIPHQGGGIDLLTSREREVLLMLSEGLLARSIAQRLAVSERTVHKHLGNLYKKLDAHDRLLAVRRAETLGLLPAPGPADGERALAESAAPARW